MFKRKSNLPPRPKIPTVQQVLEDLNSLGNDKQFLICAKVINSERMKVDDPPSEDAEFQSVKNFLKQNQNLNKTMYELKAAHDSLRASGAVVTATAEEIKEKAVKTLQ